ncbi:uncharacterized protein [Diadema antillarum]|uniref:uncharacterized protein n=1 Tax=Diadema antillarum TaxID=105358 RepID=UPI003A880BB5
MAGAPPPLPSSRPKGAYVPPPIPSNRPKVAYVHPLPPSTPEPAQEDLHMKTKQQPATIDGYNGGPGSLGRQLQAALQDRMMNNLNQMSDKPQPMSKPGTLDGRTSGEAFRQPPSSKPQLASKPAIHPAPVSAPQSQSHSGSGQGRPPVHISFGDLFGGSTKPQQQPQSQTHPFSTSSKPAGTSSSSSAFSQLAGLFGSSSSQSTGTSVTWTATPEQKAAATNYSWNVAKDVSKNVSAKDVFQAGSLLVSTHNNSGTVSATKDQQAAIGRISAQVGSSAAKNVTAEEVGHARNFATTNAVNNLSSNKDQGKQPSSFELLAQVMGSKGGGVHSNPTARARPKPSQSPNGSANIISGIPPPPSPTLRQKQAPQTQLVPPRAAPRAPIGKSAPYKAGGSSLIDFSDLSEPSKSGPPGLPKTKAQGPAGARTKPTIIRPSAGKDSRSSSPAVDQQQKKSKPPPRPSGPPTKKIAPARPSAVHGTRTAGSTPPRPSGLKPKRKAPPRPGSQKGKKQAPGAPASSSNKSSLPPRPGPGHPLYNKYMGSEPHGIALFDYQGQEADELSFKTDDVIILVKRIDSDWLVGKCNGREGMFPNQFIRIVKDLNEASESEYDGPLAVALYSFQASAPDEVSFEGGDNIKLLGTVGTVWLRGEVKGKTGIFPSNHVEVIIPLPTSSPSREGGSGPRCIAKYEYSSSNADDLQFSEGAVIKLTQRVANEWYRGELDGKSGIFPAAFVDVVEDLPPGAGSSPPSPTTGNEVRALFDFDGADSTELSLKEGDKVRVTAQVGSEWLEGEVNGKKGRFPASFVDRVPTGLPQAADPRLQNSGVEPHCVVSFDFDAQNDDEINLKAGEKITLLERIGDDWVRGKIDSREGIFPLSFVDVIIDLPSAGATASEGKALYDFMAEADDELSFKTGDVIKITERVNDEWLQGTLNGKSGRFPAAFVALSS